MTLAECMSYPQWGLIASLPTFLLERWQKLGRFFTKHVPQAFSRY
jgi:hypothetical protein